MILQKVFRILDSCINLEQHALTMKWVHSLSKNNYINPQEYFAISYHSDKVLDKFVRHKKFSDYLKKSNNRRVYDKTS